MDSDRYETSFTKIPQIVVFKVTFEKPWSVSVNQTDVLHLKICKQEFPADLIPYTNSEDCLELLQNFPLQNDELEFTIIFAIIDFAIIVMVIMLANHIKVLLMNSKVFPFISLTLTPLIMLHAFTVNVNLAEVVKLLIKRLF